jgi:hypothetical protein
MTLNHTLRLALAATSLGFGLTFAGAALAAPDLVLRYNAPAQDNDTGWEKEALPIGSRAANTCSSTTSPSGPATTRRWGRSSRLVTCWSTCRPMRPA